MLPTVRLWWAVAVAALALTAIATAELVAVVGPAAAGLAQPLTVILVAGLLEVSLSGLPMPVVRTDRREPWRLGEPSWPAWCAGWSVGPAPAIGAVHGRDGPGSPARRP
jgi:hypothetical protein